jgi:hypothetical protein
MLIVLGTTYTILLLVTQAAKGPQGWLHDLADNTLTVAALNSPYLSLYFHFLAGILLALLYGGWAEPRLPGPAWQKGILFAFAPCIFSVVVFFPLAGAGVLGFGLNAGPLPIAGNLILHLVYGSVLGLLYGPLMDRELAGPGGTHDQVHANQVVAGTFKGAAIGLSVGLLAGALMGPLAVWLLSAPTATSLALSASWLRLSAILLVSTLGCVIGLLGGQQSSLGQPPPSVSM